MAGPGWMSVVVGSEDPGAATGGASDSAHHLGSGQEQGAIDRIELASAHFATPYRQARHCEALGRGARLHRLHEGVIGQNFD